jgi:hypothetical protein
MTVHATALLHLAISWSRRGKIFGPVPVTPPQHATSTLPE